MKAITLHQPWASLMAWGDKQIETRGWRTLYHGPLAIHAAKKYDPTLQLFDRAAQGQFGEALERRQVDVDELPLGQILAIVHLDECVHLSDKWRVEHTLQRSPAPYEDLWGDYRFGRYAWLTSNRRELKFPVSCRGYQGIWDLDMETLAALHKQGIV